MQNYLNIQDVLSFLIPGTGVGLWGSICVLKIIHFSVRQSVIVCQGVKPWLIGSDIFQRGKTGQLHPKFIASSLNTQISKEVLCHVECSYLICQAVNQLHSNSNKIMACYFNVNDRVLTE